MYDKILIIILFFFPFLLGAQTKVILGVVRDAQTKDPLIGAAVLIEGTNSGAVTDLKGKYRIASIPSGEQHIVVQYLGYEKLTKVVSPDGPKKLQLDFDLELISIQGAEVTVTAQALGQMSAINKQLSSNTITNIVSAKKIQEVPDANAAESLGRLPGISILRSGGEGSKIVIRGLDPKFNKVSVEGVKMASSGSKDRSTDLSMVSPYMLEAIEVSKAAMPDKEADVIGGSVNFVLREAPEDPKLDALLQGGYAPLKNRANSYKFVLGGSRRFWDNRLGAFAQIDLEDRDRSSFEMLTQYTNFQHPQNVEDIDVSINQLLLQDIDRKVKRRGGALVLDYKLPNGVIKLSNFFSSIGTNQIIRYETMRPNFGDHFYSLRLADNQLRVLTCALKVEQTFGALKVDAAASYSATDNTLPRGIIFTANESNAFEPGLEPTQPPYKVVEAARYNVAEATVFEISKDSFFTKEGEGALALNLEYIFRPSSSVNVRLKSGVKAKELKKQFDKSYSRIPIAWAGHSAKVKKKILETYPWMGQYFSPDQGSLPYFLFRDSTYNGGVFPDDRYRVQYTPDIDLARGVTDLADGLYFKDYPNSIKDDYHGSEKYRAAYLLSEINIGKQWKFIPGVRYEHNATSYTANRGNSSVFLWNEGYQYHDTTIARSNGYWLPMFHLKYKPFKWFDVRLAYTKTLSRPSFNRIIPKWDIQSFSVSWSNPNLTPSLSTNYDAYLSFYTNKLGLLTIGGFHKNIEHLIFDPGSSVILDPQEYSLPDNVKGRPINQYVNDKYPAKLTGIEVEWQTRFWYLDNFLNGAILNINYTHTVSDVRYPRVEVRKKFIQEPPYQITENVDTFYNDRLIFQPANILNVTLGYDYKGLSSRLSLLYQDDIFARTHFFRKLRGVSTKYLRLDFSLRQKLPWKGFELLLNIANLNSAIEKDIVVGTGAPMRLQYYGATYDLGLRYRLK